MIETKDILDWCFTLSALDFGVFGFLYATYAGAMASSAAPPPITRYLRLFCWVIALVLVVLTLVSAILSYNAQVGLAVWAIVGSLILVTGFSVVLAYLME
jgi:hypothetical protein